MFVWVIFFSSIVSAQTVINDNTKGDSTKNVTLDIGLKNPISTNNFQEFVKKLFDIVLAIGVPVIALFLIYSGFLFVKAQGSPSALDEAKRTFIFTCLGALILLGAWVIANAIGETINEIKS